MSKEDIGSSIRQICVMNVVPMLSSQVAKHYLEEIEKMKGVEYKR